MSLSDKLSKGLNYLIIALLVYYIFIENTEREKNYNLNVKDAHQITTPGKLLNSTHQLEEHGWSKTHLKDLNNEMAYSPIFGFAYFNQVRLKKCELYQFVTGNKLVKVAIGDVYIGGNIFYMEYDFDTKTQTSVDKQLLPIIDKDNMPNGMVFNVYPCEEEYTTAKDGFTIKVKKSVNDGICETRLVFNVDNQPKGDVTFRRPLDEEQMYKIAPISEDNKYWFYNQKNYNMDCSGTYDGKTMEDCVGSSDMVRGLYHYKMNYIWTTGTGKVNGQRLSLELGGGIAAKHAKVNDDSFKLDDKVVHLNPLEIKYDPLNLMNSFVFKTHADFEEINENKAEIVFRSEYVKNKRDNLIFLKTHFDYVYGTFSGWVTDDEGKKIEFEGLKGFVEIVKLKW